MNISNLSPLVPIPNSFEMSEQNSPRDSNSSYKQWVKLREQAIAINKLNSMINQMSRDIKKIGERKVLDFDFFPFKLYTMPVELRPSVDQAQYTSSANWRTVRVRGGLVLTNIVSASSYVNGTDGMQNFAYYNYLPSASVGFYDIQIPISQSQYWFWVQTSGSTTPTSSNNYLRYGANPTVFNAISNPKPWSNFPSASSNTASVFNYPIGWCDTQTSGSENYMFVRQIQTTDITSAATNPTTFTASICENGTFNTYQIYGMKITGSM